MATQQLRPQGGLPGARPSLSHSREVAAAALSWLKPRLQGWPWTPLWWSSTVCPVHFPCHFRKDRGLVPSPFPSGSPSPPPHGRPTSLSATLYVLAILTERPATFHMERRRQPGSLSGDSVGPSAGTLLWARGVGVRAHGGSGAAGRPGLVAGSRLRTHPRVSGRPREPACENEQLGTRAKPPGFLPAGQRTGATGAALRNIKRGRLWGRGGTA